MGDYGEAGGKDAAIAGRGGGNSVIVVECCDIHNRWATLTAYITVIAARRTPAQKWIVGTKAVNAEATLPTTLSTDLNSPMLYKYLPKERESFFEDRLLRFTQPGDFNDPFELHPRFDILSKADLAALPKAQDAEGNEIDGRVLTPGIIGQILEVLGPGLEKQAAAHAGHGGAFAVDPNRAAQSAFDQIFGILCLSEAADILPMWAHYAGSHTGFVIQFDETHPFFSDLEFEGQTIGLSKVEYSPDRPVLSISTLKSPFLYYRKSVEWAYEREWRLIKPLAHSSRVLGHALYPRHLFEVPKEAIKGIVLGLAIPHDDRMKIFEKLAKNLPDATIFQTLLSRERYELLIDQPLDGVARPIESRVCEPR